MRLEVSLRKQFGGFGLEADFAVEGSRIGVFGRSGSGKSTLVHLLAGLLEPDAGFIRLDGQTLYSSADRVHVPPEKRRIAVVFQQPHLFPHLSLRRNLLYGYRRVPASERKIDPQALIEILDLKHLMDRGVNTLSGGERQRVALGRAVLSCPRLLLMDEPLTALDDALKYQIIPYLGAVVEEFRIPFMFISHAMIEMRLMTDQVIVLHQGRVSEKTSPEELARERMGWVRAGYINLLQLSEPEPVDDLYAYRWGGTRLMMWTGGRKESVFELSSKDIMLFKGAPEAVSARNLLRCRVVSVSDLENRVGVELDCGGQRLIATVVRQAVQELDVRPGCEVCAVIKASAFRPLY